MQVIKEGRRIPIKMWTEGVDVEDAAMQQLENLTEMPCVGPHVAVMPDCHWGFGSTVGSVIPTTTAVIPSAVGVDIGCGMMAVKLDLKASQLPDNLAAMRHNIESKVPHGRTNDGKRGDRGAWFNVPDWVQTNWDLHLADGYKKIVGLTPTLSRGSSVEQLGTLGGGNHFVEVCIDTEQNVWVMLHSGSRGVGNRIGSHYIELAKKDMERWFIQLPDKDLAFIPDGSEHFKPYCVAVEWAQNYARINREIMMGATLAAIVKTLGKAVTCTETAVNCHHNYIAREHHFGRNLWITRKGAVRARLGDLGIIPGSMGAKSFIVRGKGNEQSFHSCSHGAGRKMSRTVAKKLFTVEDHAAATMGVECRKDADVVDETPAAYKDIDAVMAAQSELVDIVATLKQVLCVKG